MPGLISHQQLTQAKRVLYMTHLAIGDFVYQGVWLKALKNKYPHLVIDIWFDDCRAKPHDWAAGRNETLSQWIRAENIVDTIYPIAASLSQRQDYLNKARDKGYDLIVFVGKNRTEEFARYARLISATAYIVATKSKSFSRFFKKRYYFSKLDGVISYDKVAKQATHITDLYADCFGQLLGLGPGDLDGPRMLKIKFDDAYATEARGKLMQLKSGHQSARTLFINHLSTSVKKDYPWAKVVDLIQQLSLKDPQLAFIVNTPPDMFEQVQADISADESLAKLPVMAFTATDNFFQLPAMMAQCDLVISVDTATTHLAACLQIPLITLIADKDSLWTAQGKGQILTGDPRASTISPATVVETYAKLIELS